MRNLCLVLLIAGILSGKTFSQVSINTDGSQADPSSILDSKSTSKGVLIPRMTQSQILAISNPANGLQVFCTSDNKLYIFISSSNEWKEIAYGSGTLILPATYYIGTGGSCNNTIVYGNFFQGLPLTVNNYVTIQVSVTIIGNYSISTNSINGYSFSANGTFSTTGTQTIKLIGSGTPILSQADQFIATASNSGGTCMFSIDVTFLGTCGSITINHVAGTVAPVTKTVTYGTVTNIPGEPSKCWITSNLGADHQATTVDDTTEASAGWYWQFNRKQGYKHDGTTRTPNTTWGSINEPLEWQATNDPCVLEIGNGWRIPTSTEWTNVDAAGSWNNWLDTWNTGLRLHTAGTLYFTDGTLYYRGLAGYCWSSSKFDNTNGWLMSFSIGYSLTYGNFKDFGFSLRCIKD
jgi:hypothetical protein